MKKSLFLIMAILLPLQANANRTNDVLTNMSDLERKKALTGFMAQSKEPCGQVIKTFYQGMANNGDAFWNVRCSNKKSYAIQIKNDAIGSTKILNCALLKAVGGGQCFKKF